MTARSKCGEGCGSMIHPAAIVESEAVGRGTRIWAFAHVMAGAVVGEDCNLGEGVFVEEGAIVGARVTLKNGVAVWKGVVLEDEVFVGPSVTFTNDRRPRSASVAVEASWLVSTRIGRGATLGAASVILPGCDVGPWAFVGAGSVVTRPVAPHARVQGNPARFVTWVCRCGADLGEEECPRCHGSAGTLRALLEEEGWSPIDGTRS